LLKAALSFIANSDTCIMIVIELNGESRSVDKNHSVQDLINVLALSTLVKVTAELSSPKRVTSAG
jgi:hypothetical protein